ncbi:MAG: MMPL family transporter [Clostridia bacterium]
MQLVNINYDMSAYLPDDAPTTVALTAYDQIFDEEPPNLNVYMPDVSLTEALETKQRLSEIDGVRDVLWLDDIADVKKPIQMQDKALVEAWYKDDAALFMMAVDATKAVSVIGQVKSIVGEGVALSGDAYNQSEVQNSGMAEVGKIMYYVLPLVFIILLLSTSSWLEPLLFLVTIGIAILINEGTNIVMGEISFITQATAALLQLAVSMDYAVFLLHAFQRWRDTGLDVVEAMKKAMCEAASTIAASATTTIAGFLVLALMSFKIGPDMGIVLAKGVVLSYIAVMFLLPVMIVTTSKLLDKTRHRPFLPSFKRFGNGVSKLFIPLSIVVALIIVPSYLAQRSNDFKYGSSGMHSEDSYVQQEANLINKQFGQHQQMVLLVPSGDPVAEEQLSHALMDVENISSVTSYATAVGTQIPDKLIPKDQLSQLRANGYSRIILYATTTDEGEEAFKVVEDVRNTAKTYYGESYHMLGQNAVNYDLKSTIISDSALVTWAAILSIGLILLLTFKNISIPIILVLTIEGAIWINLGLPYFAGNTLNYIGYQIISSVQLGATVDYGILFAQKYMENRKTMTKLPAVSNAVSSTAASILTPVAILACAGIMLGVVSSSRVISELGTILGRGAIISGVMVMLFLPAMLVIFDTIVQRTSFNWPKLKHRKTSKGGN